MDGRTENWNLWRTQVVRTLNFPLLNCLTKQNHMWGKKDGEGGRRAERSGKSKEGGGSVVWEKCYNSELLSGVRSLNYSEMWTACQWRGLSQSCGATLHTAHCFIYPILSQFQADCLSLCLSIYLSWKLLSSFHFWHYNYVPMCYNKSMAFHTCIRTTLIDIYWSRKLDCPSKIDTGHLPFLQRNILVALAKVLPPHSLVVTMTSGRHKSSLWRFYGSSSLHLNNQSFAAIVKSNVLICL